MNHPGQSCLVYKAAYLRLHYMFSRYQVLFLTATLLGIAAYLYPIYFDNTSTSDTSMAAARLSRSVIKKVYAVETSEVSG